MKSLLFAFAVILLDAMGCGSRHDVEDDYLNVTPSRVMLENQKGACGVISVSSNVHWTVSKNNGDWLEVSPNSGDGKGEIIVTAKSSTESAYMRNSTIVIVGGAIQQRVDVTQIDKQ